MSTNEHVDINIYSLNSDREQLFCRLLLVKFEVR